MAQARRARARSCAPRARPPGKARVPSHDAHRFHPRRRQGRARRAHHDEPRGPSDLGRPAPGCDDPGPRGSEPRRHLAADAARAGARRGSGAWRRGAGQLPRVRPPRGHRRGPRRSRPYDGGHGVQPARHPLHVGHGRHDLGPRPRARSALEVRPLDTGLFAADDLRGRPRRSPRHAARGLGAARHRARLAPARRGLRRRRRRAPVRDPVRSRLRRSRDSQRAARRPPADRHAARGRRRAQDAVEGRLHSAERGSAAAQPRADDLVLPGARRVRRHSLR